MALRFLVYGSLRTESEAGIGSGLYESYAAQEGQTVFSLGGTYRPGMNELQVYVNGVRQMLNVDYTETDNRTVTFLYPLEEGDLVLFTVSEVRRMTLHEEHVAEEGQTLFVLSRPYHPGWNSLQVYINGLLMRKEEDYREVDEYTVEFLYPLSAGMKVTFHEVV